MVKAIRIGNFWCGEAHPVYEANTKSAYYFTRMVGADAVLKKLGSGDIEFVNGYTVKNGSVSIPLTIGTKYLLCIGGASGSQTNYTISGNSGLSLQSKRQEGASGFYGNCIVYYGEAKTNSIIFTSNDVYNFYGILLFKIS